MGYRDLEEQREQSLRASAARRLMWFVAVYLAISFVFFLLYLRERLKEPPVPSGVVAVSFGLSRSPAIRSVLIPLNRPSTSSPEGTVAVELSKDPQSSTSNAQFPANQITVAGNQLASDSVLLSIAVDPWSPEPVPAGRYEGQLVLSGPGNNPPVPLLIILQNRDGWLAWLAASLLMGGALLGLAVKWVTERLTPLAPFSRRLTQLRRAIGWRLEGRNVPLSLRLQIEDLADRIARGDSKGADDLFQQLEPLRERAATVSSQLNAIFDQLDEQLIALKAAGLDVTDFARVDAVLNEEYRKLLDVQAMKWQADNAPIFPAIQNLRGEVVVASQVVAAFLRNPRETKMSQALDALQRGQYSEADRLYTESRGVADREPQSPDNKRRKANRHVPDAFRLNRYAQPSTQWWFKHARVIAAIASAIVVTLVGLKSQYLDDQAFSGALTSWMTLGLWGLAVELSGVSILDVLSRLSPTSTVAVSPNSVVRPSPSDPS
ncbi:MAG TPA: hypothetical protein VF062_13985 [Candidatus Limnocylindrales bacterium]